MYCLCCWWCTLFSLNTHFSSLSGLLIIYLKKNKSMRCGVPGYTTMWKTLENCRTDHYHCSRAFYLGVYVLLIWAVSGAWSWPVCSSEADIMKQMLGRCQGYNVLGGVRSLINRLLRTCLTVDVKKLGREWEPRDGIWRSQPFYLLYVFGIDVLHFSSAFEIG